MTAQLPILQLLLPLIGAPLCLLVRRKTAAWVIFLLAGAGALACAVAISIRVATVGTISYAVGGWSPPHGIELVVAPFNTPLLLVVSAMAVVVAVYGRRSILAELDDRRVPLLYTCLCLLLGALLGLSVTGDVFNAFVFLEISSLATYALVAMGRRREALLASFRYLIIGTVGATFVLIGIGLAYAVTGTLNMADLAQRVTLIENNRALLAAVVFVFVGLAIKMAVFPLHAWLPGAYAEAPSVVGTFLAATSTKVAIYLFCRFAFTVFGASLVFERMPIELAGLVLACLAMLVGSAVACFQTNLKHLLAWSSVGQIGYIVAGISLATTAGVSAGYLHLINHAVIKAALFAIAGLLVFRLGSARLESLAGLGRRMPWTFGAFVVAGLGLIGVPPTGGFTSKWALATAMIESGRWPVLLVILISSLLALIYVGRVVEIAWFRKPEAVADSARTPISMAVPVGLLVVASVYFGIDPTLPAALADAAAAALLGAAG